MPNYLIEVSFVTRGEFTINAKSIEEAYDWVDQLESSELAQRCNVTASTPLFDAKVYIDDWAAENADRPEDDTIGVNV